jgi:hypothetical protein
VNVNPRVVGVREWVGEDEWRSATPYVREAYVRFCAAELLKAKQRQVGECIGADGRPLLRVLPGSRPDGSRDFPLIPHHERSRAMRLLRAIPNENQGYITFNWHHWTRILGYHREGIPSRLGPRVRDLFGTPGRFLRPVKARCIAYWRHLRPERIVAVQPRIAAIPAERRPKIQPPARPRREPTNLPPELIRNPSSGQTRVFWQ